MNGKMRVSIVATALDEQGPETKPVINLVHRIHNRNIGYSDNSINNSTASQPTLSSTEGATALDMSKAIEENKVVQQQEEHEKINEKLIFLYIFGFIFL